MDTALKQALTLAARRHSVITDATLRSLGLTIEQRKRLVRDGHLERMLDGSYRIGGTNDDEMARCVAACSRPELIVCGPTAGRIRNLRRMPRDGLVWVIAPPASNPTVEPWLRPYRTALIEPGDVVERSDGIRLTSPARTAVDLSRHLPPTDLRSVIDQLVHERLCTADDMRRVAETLATPGRPWARRFLRELDKLPSEIAPESHWESRVVAALVERGVPLEPQRWLDVPNWGRIRLDGCVSSIQWGVEVDVFPDHFTEEGVTKDAERDLACDAIGWSVARVTGLSLRRDFVGRIDALLRAYRRRVDDVRR